MRLVASRLRHLLCTVPVLACVARWRLSSPHRKGVRVLRCSVSRTPLRGPPKFISPCLLPAANRPRPPSSFLTIARETLNVYNTGRAPPRPSRASYLATRTRGASQISRREKLPAIGAAILSVPFPRSSRPEAEPQIRFNLRAFEFDRRRRLGPHTTLQRPK